MGVSALSNAMREEIERAFNLKIVNEQFFPWGEFYWLDLSPTDRKAQSNMSIVKVYPLQEQKIHTHPGYEEIVIGLEGELTHLCDDREITIKKGQVGYIRVGGQHRMRNSSDRPAIFLSVVTPVLSTLLGELSPIDDVELVELIELMRLELITDKFSQSVGLAVTLISAQGDKLTEPKNLPEFCKLCYSLRAGDCAICSNLGITSVGNEQKIYNCRYGLTSFLSPIIINGRLLGYLGCGYELLEVQTQQTIDLIHQYFPVEYVPLAKKAYLKLVVLTRNHLVSSAETILLVTTSLVQLIIFSAREKQMTSYRLNLSLEKQKQAELESSLKEVRLKFLESQVNPHFLFNTLNTIAQMAVMEGATTVSSLTYALSNLLRCSLGKSDSLITVKEELDYVKDYIFIQKTRFPHKFETHIDVDNQITHVKIPFMTLMVLVENSIIHGFSDMKRAGNLYIKGFMEDETAVFVVEDNGRGVPQEVISQIENLNKTGLISSGMNSIGLRNIYMRFKHFYGDEFSLAIDRLAKQGTKVIIKIDVDK